MEQKKRNQWNGFSLLLSYFWNADADDFSTCLLLSENHALPSYNAKHI